MSNDTLAALAATHGTDKRHEIHDYVRTYDRHLVAMRDRVRSVLELGTHNGASLLMWRDYFAGAVVHGVDLKPPVSLQGPRITQWRGDQCDADLLSQVVAACGGSVDLIVDDGAHTHATQIQSFKLLWPCVSPGGIYIVEDTCCSYWSEFKGAYPPPDQSTITFLQGLVHDVHLRGYRKGHLLHRAPHVLLPSLARKRNLGALHDMDVTIEEITFANSTVLIRKRGHLP